MQITRASGYRYRLFRRTPRALDGLEEYYRIRQNQFPVAVESRLRRLAASRCCAMSSGSFPRENTRYSRVRVGLRPRRTFLVQILKRASFPACRSRSTKRVSPSFLTEKKSSVVRGGSYSRTMRSVRECHGRRGGGSGSRNEPSWETGERGSVVVLFAIIGRRRVSLPEARE